MAKCRVCFDTGYKLGSPCIQGCKPDGRARIRQSGKSQGEKPKPALRFQEEEWMPVRLDEVSPCPNGHSNDEEKCTCERCKTRRKTIASGREQLRSGPVSKTRSTDIYESAALKRSDVRFVVDALANYAVKTKTKWDDLKARALGMVPADKLIELTFEQVEPFFQAVRMAIGRPVEWDGNDAIWEWPHLCIRFARVLNAYSARFGTMIAGDKIAAKRALVGLSAGAFWGDLPVRDTLMLESELRDELH